MKKLLLAAIGATGLLASCGDPGTGLSADLKTITFTSEHVLQADVRGTDGVLYPKGTPVICDNMDTDINARITYTGSVGKVNLQLQGSGGGYTNLYAYPGNVIDTDGTLDVTYTIGKGLAPQGITVNPVIVTEIKRYTRIQAYANNNRNDVVTSNVIPVVDCTMVR